MEKENMFQKDIKEVCSYDVRINTKKIFKVVSLFSGCGGMDLGFKGGFEFLSRPYAKNPFEIIFVNDIFKEALQVYEHNFQHKTTLQDITKLDMNKIPQADIVIGGFPCQDFSLAGKRRGLESERGRLYQQMIKVIKHCNAKMFIAENVDGIRLNKANKEVKNSALDIILKDFEKLGYIVKYKVLNAADYGVPQLRKRVIITGVRKDIYQNIYYPLSTHSDDNKTNKAAWVTSKDAIDDLWDKIDSDSVLNHTSRDYSKAKFYPGKKTQGNTRISAYRPSCTIRAEHHGNIEAHYRTTLPDENDMSGWRRLSIRECARIQSFPDDYHFNVSASSAYKMIGNAVPPVLAWHIARAVYHTLASSLENKQLEFEYQKKN